TALSHGKRRKAAASSSTAINGGTGWNARPIRSGKEGRGAFLFIIGPWEWNGTRAPCDMADHICGGVIFQPSQHVPDKQTGTHKSSQAGRHKQTILAGLRGSANIHAQREPRCKASSGPQSISAVRIRT